MTETPDELEFLKLAEEVSQACAGVSEEDLVLLLSLLRDRLMVDLSAAKGPERATELADRLIVGIFRRR